MQRRIVSPVGDRHPSYSKNKLMERRLVMIDKPTNLTASNSADVPRVGGEDDSRACDQDFRVGGEDDSRELVDNQPRSASVAEKS